MINMFYSVISASSYFFDDTHIIYSYNISDKYVNKLGRVKVRCHWFY